MADYHAPNTQGVRWTLVSLVEEWSSNITSAITQKEHCVCHYLLSVASRVGDLERQNHDKSCVVGPGEQVADISAYSVLAGYKVQPKRAGNVRAQEDQNEETALVGEFVVEEDAGQDGQGDEGAVGYLHKCSDKCREAEPFDDDGPEVGDTSIGDVTDDSQGEEKVELVVLEGFPDLVRLEVLVLAASLVGS